jgi:hypothetical protein
MLPDYMKPQLDAEFEKLKQEKHNALNLGIDYINQVIKLSTEGVSPQFGIAYCMLERGTDDDMDNFEFQINHRHLQDPNYLFDDNAFRRNVEQELQGFVDVTMTLIAMCVYINSKVTKSNQDDRNLFRQVQRIPQVHSLPAFVEETALKFAEKYFDEILEELEGTKLDFAFLLDKITAKAKNNTRLTQNDLVAVKFGLPVNNPASTGSFYYRGALTSHDTYLLYYELVHAMMTR